MKNSKRTGSTFPFWHNDTLSVGQLCVILPLLALYIYSFHLGERRSWWDSFHIINRTTPAPTKPPTPNSTPTPKWRIISTVKSSSKSNLRSSNRTTTPHSAKTSPEPEADSIQFSYLSDGQSCLIPRMKPFSKIVLQYLEKQPTYRKCEEFYPLLFSSTFDGQVTPEKTPEEYARLGIADCCYRVITRGQSGFADTSYKKSVKCYPISLSFATRIPASHEFIAISCTKRKSNETHAPLFKHGNFWKSRNQAVVDMHAFIPEKPEIQSRPNQAESKVNVVIFGIDAVSRMNFLRTMPKSYEFLTKTLGAVDLSGYNKVADNTFPNIMPMLTSLSNSEVGSGCGKRKIYDSCPFIWKTFAKHGYATSFAEDESSISIFNFERKGFIGQPTDYYLKPFAAAANIMIASQIQLSSHLCYGPRLGFQVLLDYMKKFVSQMTKMGKPYFQFTWATSLTHDYLNAPELGDKHLLSALQWLQDQGYFNTTVFLLMSDHGQRVDEFRSTLQGQLEDRLPFLFLQLPEWMRTGNYSIGYENLLGNRQRLVTTFDLHETLQDLLHLRNGDKVSIQERSLDLQNKTRKDASNMPRGISLFLPVPKQRTCKMAGIERNYCSCDYLRPINIKQQSVSQAATVALNKINSMIKLEKKCAQLKLDSIKMARKGDKSHNFDFEGFQINFETKPGGALFEALVSKTKGKGWEVLGTIARINRYGNQSHCIHDSLLKLYCYCKT